ncbi:DUF2975 domain-containing protein [Seonamhaeicola marinus]|uniref:DUF2975 domain-containing protein n=1 Tax=Seonamhaeicola marinus TaxID=1912246 RepID=A0A5D0HL61_9FLAO|nr:DUF2975 domain-containing protein [Seonamhaeicola marinus]TYA71710.1 DUF2975 domain-containing protein [Seonamhaeicola marinus]
MKTIVHKKSVVSIYKLLKIIWILQWIVLLLTILYSLFGLNLNTFFSENYTLEISEVPFYLDQKGWIELDNGTKHQFSISSALGNMKFLDNDVGLLRLIALRKILFQLTGIYIVLLVIRLCKSLLNNDPFKEVNAKRLRVIGFLTLGISLFNTVFIFQLGKYLKGKINIEVLTPNVNTHIDYSVLLFGLLILVISEVFRIGVKIQKEQRLFV